MNTLSQIASMVHNNAKLKGFHRHEATESFMHREWLNLIGEVSELQESFRDGTLLDICNKGLKMAALGLPPLTNIEEEYADIVIRALDQCKRLGIDIERAVIVKHHYNKTRPEMHGRKF